MILPRICLLNPYPPSVSPRLVRNANVLAAAGFDVVVVTTRLPKRLLPHEEFPKDFAWRYEFVDLTESAGGRLRWQFCRLRRKLFLALVERKPARTLISRACTYAGPELATLAAAQKADIYISHTHGALPAAAAAARRTQAKLVFDAEDMLAECSDEPMGVMRCIEETFVPQSSLITTMSRAAALRLQERLQLSQEPLVLHNTPSLKEREGVLPPSQRAKTNRLRVYWFGQRIGRHSCADQVLHAMARMKAKAVLVLRGTPDPAYLQELQTLAQRLGLSDALEIQPRALPSEMVRLAAENDVALGTQPSDEPFHQLAVGNKVFTGLMAGLAIGLTDTTAHRRLSEELTGSSFLFPNNDHPVLASRLEELASSPKKLQDMKSAAWSLAGERFNWECESLTWLRVVRRLLNLPETKP